MPIIVTVRPGGCLAKCYPFKPTNHRAKILQYLEILKIKMNQEQLDSFLQHHTKAALPVSELLAKFLEQPANASQESSIQARIRRAGFPTEATLESYDWTRNPETIHREPFLTPKVR